MLSVKSLLQTGIFKAVCCVGDLDVCLGGEGGGGVGGESPVFLIFPLIYLRRFFLSRFFLMRYPF